MTASLSGRTARDRYREVGRWRADATIAAELDPALTVRLNDENEFGAASFEPDPGSAFPRARRRTTSPRSRRVKSPTPGCSPRRSRDARAELRNRPRGGSTTDYASAGNPSPRLDLARRSSWAADQRKQHAGYRRSWGAANAGREGRLRSVSGAGSRPAAHRRGSRASRRSRSTRTARRGRGQHAARRESSGRRHHRR
jgi:hypothetical protein